MWCLCVRQSVRGHLVKSNSTVTVRLTVCNIQYLSVLIPLDSIVVNVSCCHCVLFNFKTNKIIVPGGAGRFLQCGYFYLVCWGNTYRSISDNWDWSTVIVKVTLMLRIIVPWDLQMKESPRGPGGFFQNILVMTTVGMSFQKLYCIENEPEIIYFLRSNWTI